MDPFAVRPLLKEKPWGGRNLAAFYGKALPPHGTWGEAWEVSDLAGNASSGASGEWEGRPLDRVVLSAGEMLVGARQAPARGLPQVPHLIRSPLPPGEGIGVRVPAGGAPRLPFLIKLIDAAERLSLQVHPDEAYLRKAGIDEAPKAEAWYVLQAAAGARIVTGLDGSRTASDLAHIVRSPDALADALHWVEVHPGDAFFLPPGTLHAIGEGIVLYEIQVPSDRTIRLWDWGRGRETEPENAIAAFHAADPPPARLDPVPVEGSPVRAEHLVRSMHFTLDRVFVDAEMEEPAGRLAALTVIEGRGCVVAPRGVEIPCSAGQTILVPAAATGVRLVPEPSMVLLRATA